MRLADLSLSSRITALGVLLVSLGGLLWGYNENNRLAAESLLMQEQMLESGLHAESERLRQQVEILRQDVSFLAETPPIGGIMRAASHGGVDPRDGESQALWKRRLSEIFQAYLRAHPEYSQACLIAVADGGRELVRVERELQQVHVTAADALQRKGERDYFQAALTLPPGAIHLSEFNLNREHGLIKTPHHPMLRAAKPVFDEQGRRFGMLVLSLDARHLLAPAAQLPVAGSELYIADQYGHYLWHPDAARAFTFEMGSADDIRRDFPVLHPLFAEAAQHELTLRQGALAGGGYLAAVKVAFDPAAPQRFLVLAVQVPASVLAAQTPGISSGSLLKALLWMVLAAGLFHAAIRYMLRPLRYITHAAGEIALRQRTLSLKRKGSGEIGRLVEALNSMLQTLSGKERIEAELKRSQALRENSMEGVHVMDVDGNVLEVNEAFCRMLGYTRDEALRLNVRQWDDAIPAAELPQRLRGMVGHSATFETVHRRKDGSLLDVEVCASGVQVDGKSYIYAASRDITLRKHAELVLQRHHLVIETALDGFLEEVNEAYARLSGYSRQELIGMHISQLEASERPEDVKAHIERIIAQGQDRFETRHRRKDGRLIDLEVSVTFRDAHFFVFCRNITRRKESEAALRIAAATFETQEAILITDAEANIVRVNSAFTAITGYTLDDVCGKNPRILSSGRHDHEFYEEMWRQIKEQGSWSGDIWDRRKNGEVYPKRMNITAVKDEQGRITQYVAIFNDITERKRNEEEIRELAFFDALTHLPNRRLFLDRLRSALATSTRHGEFGALLFIDLDRFKVLNDTLGHDYGDLLLVEVAARIKHCVRETDTVARLGGDEFVVILEGIGPDREAASTHAGTVAEKIRESLAHAYQLKEHEHFTSPSIGVELFHDGGMSADELIKHADVAMYQAKSAGRNTVRFYDPDLQHDLESRAEMENDLRRAIENQELKLYYQVQVDNERRLVGMEALLRWEHPQRGMIPPARFIPVAEESMLILELGEWVLNQACAQLARWTADPVLGHMTLSINVSAHQFALHDFVSHLRDVLQRHGVAPQRLKLELTEGVVLNDISDVVEKMKALKQVGVQLSLDDFGTGYSSLAYLKRLPLDQLKIDQSFVRDITHDPSDAGMVQSIIDMAKNFQHDVIAEGVENEAQLAFLQHHACMTYQGYLFSKPLPLQELEALVRDWDGLADPQR